MDITYYGPLLLLSLCFIALSWFAGSDAPYVATKMKLINKVLKAAGLKKGKVFYELGSGDGRVVFAAANMGAVAHGIEQSWLRVLYCRWKKIENTFFHHGNVFNFNYSEADVVYIYLLTKGVHRLEPKLKKELKKGATVITQTYHFKNWKPSQKIENFLSL